MNPGYGGSLRALWRRSAKRLAGDTGWAAVVELVTMVSGLVVMFVISTRLGPGAYGYFVGAQALIAALGMVSYGAVAQLLMQGIVRDRRPPGEVFGRALGLALATTCAALLTGLLLSGILFPGLDAAVFGLLAVAELLGMGAVVLSAAYRQALDAYRESVIPRVLLLLGRTGAVVGLAALGSMSLGQVAAAFCVLGLLVAAVVLGQLRVRDGVPLRPRKPTTQEVCDGMSAATSLLAFSVHEDADKVLMVRLADPVTAGLYAAAYRAVQVVAAPIKALVTASHRRFLVHDPDATGEHTRRSRAYTVLGASYGILASAVAIAAAPLLPAVLGEDYRGSVPMVQVLAVLVLLRGLGAFSFNGLLGLGAHGYRMYAISVAAVAAAVLNLTLIPRFSWWGGAVATLAAEFLFVALAWWALLRAQRRHDRAVGASVVATA
ncbi:lipopolysaccharide biosynthesis protein [Blastococcus sp. VKM Ac-2987]|uniref:lipopolysaccharide biosynthesis protein n=1 Tax=Blastococcus sp. VKM Ac-2987 TaxID=3004141 RepID=UPI0022ABC0EF|nr:lipopolysaccharide biosynthesis protein [Blastococcus sp. VKM Ac-2987]MCZ2858469.1 lipopolysaccharide biosynthesis protein [Blastococcus sp. VKM Ac-2987]